jgi:hypothetical protein
MTDQPLDTFELAKAIKADPVYWAEALFGFTCWSWQADVIRSVFAHRRTVVPTGHALGKTMLVPSLALLWALANPKSYVVITAASWDSLKLKIFPSIKSMVLGQKLPVFAPGVEPNADFFQIAPEWAIVGLSPDKPEPFQGYHSVGKDSGTLVIIDESSNITYALFRAITSLTTSDFDAILMLGNPLHVDGPFADVIIACSGEQPVVDPADEDAAPQPWHMIHASSLDSPNVIHNRNVVSGLATRAWVDEMKRELKPHEYESRVLGLVPTQEEDTLIPRSDVEKAGKREVPAWQTDGRLVMGVDPAHSTTGDRSVITVRGDMGIHYLWSKVGIETEQRVEQVERVWREFNSTIAAIHVDSTGYGHDMAVELEKRGYPVVRVNASGMPVNKKKYLNQRMECWALMAEAFKRGLAIPPQWIKDFMEVASVHFSESRERLGILQLESKDRIKERIRKSPDVGDALALTYGQVEGQAAFLRGVNVPLGYEFLRMVIRPLLWFKGSRWRVFTDKAGEFRAGQLYRASIYGIGRECGSLIVHVDTFGCWTIVSCVKGKDLSFEDFWCQVKLTDVKGEFTDDIYMAGDQAAVTSQGTWQRITDHPGIAPRLVGESLISGPKGVPQLGMMVRSTLARMRLFPPWDQIKDDTLVPTREWLLSWPDEPIRELEAARIKDMESWRDLGMEDRREELVGGGGPLVKCLRALIVSGAGEVA